MSWLVGKSYFLKSLRAHWPRSYMESNERFQGLVQLLERLAAISTASSCRCLGLKLRPPCVFVLILKRGTIQRINGLFSGGSGLEVCSEMQRWHNAHLSQDLNLNGQRGYLIRCGTENNHHQGWTDTRAGQCAPPSPLKLTSLCFYI